MSSAAVASLASQKYFVFECLLDEASGWSAMSIKRQGADFNTDRFASLKAFYFIELNQVGIQVYRANDANPVSAIICSNIVVFDGRAGNSNFGTAGVVGALPARESLVPVLWANSEMTAKPYVLRIHDSCGRLVLSSCGYSVSRGHTGNTHDRRFFSVLFGSCLELRGCGWNSPLRPTGPNLTRDISGVRRPPQNLPRRFTRRRTPVGSRVRVSCSPVPAVPFSTCNTCFYFPAP